MTTWYKVCIDADNGHYNDYLPWFENFINESGFYDSDEHDIDVYLKPYRTRNVKNEPYIEFETEQDYTAFVLRWA